MILYRWRGASRNFGDELNTLLWPRLLPGFFDDDPDALFLGIGSILDRRHPAAGRKLVAGAGYGGYEPPPRLDRNWIIHWVRGPHTAEVLGLPTALGLGDPALLLPAAGLAPPLGGGPVGFMPHFESARHGVWQAAAAMAGLRWIDPRDEPAAVIAAIASCRMLLSEALHGVIVADALRVPWVAIRPQVPINRPKWADWAATLQLDLVFRRLPASTLGEWLRGSRVAGYHMGRRLLDRHAGLAGPPRLADALLQRAAAALRQAAAATPQLSSEVALLRSQARMLSALAALRRDPLFDGCGAAVAGQGGKRSAATPPECRPGMRWRRRQALPQA